MKIVIGRPCCSWRRSCKAQSITVYDVSSKSVVDEIYPTRCWELWIEGREPEKITLEFDETRHLIFYRYRTIANRGRIVFYNIPPTLNVKDATELVRKLFDYDEISKIVIAKPTTDDIYLYSLHYYRPIQ